MANCMLGFPNRVDASELSGGSWVPTLPITNLQTRLLGEVARSTDLDPASTQFDVDLGASKMIRLLSIRNHNLSLTARLRVRGSLVADFSATKIDTGWLDVWPVVYPHGTLEWEEDNWWSGRYTDEQRGGYIPERVVVLPSNVLARYWRIEIEDENNPDGYIDLGRLFIGQGWQPKYNMSQSGASIGWETKTEVQEARSGAEYFDERPSFRVARFALEWLSQDEAFANAFEIQRRAGISQEVLWVHNPDDTVHAIRRQFLGRMRTLSPIEFPYPHNKVAFEIKENQ